MADAYGCLLTQAALDKEILGLADNEPPLGLAVARAAAQAAGFRGQVALGPVSMEDSSALINQDIFLTSAKARRVLGWRPRQPGILASMDGYYQSWKASQALEAG